MVGRRVLHTTKGFPSTCNDKTMAHQDLFLKALKNGVLKARDGSPVSDLEFKYYDSNGELCSARGPFVICDNGYHRWRILQTAPKFSSDRYVLGWAKRMESVRKDVECTFGIMKKRFRELRLPSEFVSAKTVTHTFKTCCHLHNRLLKYDKLDTIGQLESDWLASELSPAEIQAERDRRIEA